MAKKKGMKGKTSVEEWFFEEAIQEPPREEPRLRESETKIIDYIAKSMEKAVPMRELSDFMNASTVSVAVKNLEQRGIVKKIRSKSKGRGQYVVRLIAFPREMSQSQIGDLHLGTPLDPDSAFFLENIKMMQPVFDALEVDERRELDEVNICYLMDFSEVHDLLHPEMSIYPSLGWALYMFQEKLKGDRYIFPPPAAFEMLSHMAKTAREAKKYSNFQEALKNRNFEQFLNALSRPCPDAEIMYKRLIRAYSKMGPLRELIILADDAILEDLFPRTISRLGKLVKNEILIPLDTILEDVAKSSVDPNVYHEVLRYLSNRRFVDKMDQRNVVDALNMGLAYNLTDKRYESNEEYYSLVTHSRKPLMIFKKIFWENDPFGVNSLVRTPLFLSTRIYLRNKIPDPKERVDHIADARKTLGYLWERRDFLVYDERFYGAFQKGGTAFIEEDLVPVAKLLKQASLYEKKFSQHVQSMISRNKKIIRQVKRRSPKQLAEILEPILRDREDYENRMSRAHETIMENVRETYRVLRNFLDVKYHHLLTPKMTEWLSEFDQYLKSMESPTWRK